MRVGGGKSPKRDVYITKDNSFELGRNTNNSRLKGDTEN